MHVSMHHTHVVALSVALPGVRHCAGTLGLGGPAFHKRKYAPSR
jgi:hypothetical protein